jgi:hypothetical protein
MTHDPRLTTLLLLVLPLACTRPPGSVSTPRPLDTATAPADCNAPPVANQPEGCADDVPRPANAPPVDRPGADRDGDAVEDILDACPDEPEDVDGDRDDDGCPDADTTEENPPPS